MKANILKRCKKKDRPQGSTISHTTKTGRKTSISLHPWVDIGINAIRYNQGFYLILKKVKPLHTTEKCLRRAGLNSPILTLRTKVYRKHKSLNYIH